MDSRQRRRRAACCSVIILDLRRSLGTLKARGRRNQNVRPPLDRGGSRTARLPSSSTAAMTFSVVSAVGFDRAMSRPAQATALKHNHPTPSLRNRPRTGAPASQGRAKLAQSKARGSLDGPTDRAGYPAVAKEQSPAISLHLHRFPSMRARARRPHCSTASLRHPSARLDLSGNTLCA
jgi:hypothetical protein